MGGKPRPLRRWWISWYEPAPTSDYRPRIWPLPAAIPHYWCTGWAGEEAVLCAVVDAPTEELAKAAVKRAGWSPNRLWRFCDEKGLNWLPPADRFPRDEHEPRACRVCSCTDDDCSGCVERIGEPCHWVESDLCSACVRGG